MYVGGFFLMKTEMNNDEPVKWMSLEAALDSLKISQSLKVESVALSF